MPNSKTELGEVWWTLGLNPITSQVFILGISRDEKTAKQHYERRHDPDCGEDCIYACHFQLCPAKDSPRQISYWLKNCGVPKDETINIMQQLAQNLRKILNEQRQQL